MNKVIFNELLEDKYSQKNTPQKLNVERIGAMFFAVALWVPVIAAGSAIKNSFLDNTSEISSNISTVSNSAVPNNQAPKP